MKIRYIAFVIFITLTIYFMRDNDFENTKSDGIKNELLQKEMEDKIFSKQITPTPANVTFVVISTSQVKTWNATTIVPEYHDGVIIRQVSGITEWTTMVNQLKGRLIKQIDIQVVIATIGGSVSIEGYVTSVQLSSVAANPFFNPVPLGIDLNRSALALENGVWNLYIGVKYDRSLPLVAADTTQYEIRIVIKVQYY